MWWPWKKKKTTGGIITPSEFLNRCVPEKEQRERDRDSKETIRVIDSINETLDLGYTEVDILYGVTEEGKEVIRERLAASGWCVEFTTYDSIKLTPLDSETTE
jgi:hypothetical protein